MDDEERGDRSRRETPALLVSSAMTGVLWMFPGCGPEQEGLLAAFTLLSPGGCRGLDPQGGQTDRIRGNSWLKPHALQEGVYIPQGPWRGQLFATQSHSRSVVFPKPRCLLMSWGEGAFSPRLQLWAPHYLGPKRLAWGQQALAMSLCPVPARPAWAAGAVLPTRCISRSLETLT